LSSPVQKAAEVFWITPSFVGFIVAALSAARRKGLGIFWCAKTG
jgi:hypothetical protein